MDPRKKTSRGRKSTNLPLEYIENVKTLVGTTFKKPLKGRPVIIEGRIYPDEILFSIGFKEADSALKQINFEASIDHNGQHIMRKLATCLDCVSSMIEQYFEAGEDLDLPRHWQPFAYEKDTVYLQSTGRNSELEAQANKLLGHKRGDELLVDDSEDPDNLEELTPEEEAELAGIKASLGVAEVEDDFEDDPMDEVDDEDDSKKPRH